MTTDSRGIARFVGVGEGTYAITETKAPEGYETLKNPVIVTLVTSDMETSKRTLSATVDDKQATLVSVKAGEGMAVLEIQDSRIGKKTPTEPAAGDGGSRSANAGSSSGVVRAVDSVLPTTADKLVALGGGILVAAVTVTIVGMAARRSRADSHVE